MTLGDVKRQILNLGFETAGTYDDEPTIMIDAINMAMREITNLFPLVGSYKIAQYPLANLLGNGHLNSEAQHYDGKIQLKYSATGAKAIYFEYTGAGALEIRDNEGVRTIHLTGGRSFQEYRAFVSGNVTLTFTGSFSYDVRNIAIYGETFSDALSDIPAFRRHVRYDFKELTKVDDKSLFIDFMDKVMEGDGAHSESYVSSKDFRVEGRHVLVLDGTKHAEYTVFYKKNFLPVTKATPDTTELELDYDKEHLLPLLAAWYVWADDDPSKAAKCRNDYEDYVSQLLALKKASTAQESFSNDLGW